MAARHQYRIDLSAAALPDVGVPVGVELRAPLPGDAGDLAELMLDAYRGTIDYDGEGLAEAVAEVDSYLNGFPMLPESVVAHDGDGVLSACLISRYEDRALVGYVMTAAAHKGHGFGTLVTIRALEELRAAGLSAVDAWITAGNVPSERIFLGLGFVVID